RKTLFLVPILLRILSLRTAAADWVVSSAHSWPDTCSIVPETMSSPSRSVPCLSLDRLLPCGSPHREMPKPFDNLKQTDTWGLVNRQRQFIAGFASESCF